MEEKQSGMAIDTLLPKKIDKSDALKNVGLQLLSDGKPNNGALALFGTNINDARFNLRMARFRGTDKNEFIDNQKVKGNFFELLDAGMAFFFKWLALSGKIVGYMKLLFPHWISAADVNKEEFDTYCLQRAIRRRGIIKAQCHYIDPEFKTAMRNCWIKEDNSVTSSNSAGAEENRLF